VYAALIGAHA